MLVTGDLGDREKVDRTTHLIRDTLFLERVARIGCCRTR